MHLAATTGMGLTGMNLNTSTTTPAATTGMGMPGLNLNTSTTTPTATTGMGMPGLNIGTSTTTPATTGMGMLGMNSNTTTTNSTTTSAQQVEEAIKSEFDLSYVRIRNMTAGEVVSEWKKDLEKDVKLFEATKDKIISQNEAIMKAEKDIEEIRAVVEEMSVMKNQLNESLQEIENQQNKMTNTIKELENKNQQPQSTDKGVVEEVCDIVNELKGRYDIIQGKILEQNYAKPQDGQKKEYVQILQLLNSHRRTIDWMNDTTGEIKEGLLQMTGK